MGHNTVEPRGAVQGAEGRDPLDTQTPHCLAGDCRFMLTRWCKGTGVSAAPKMLALPFLSLTPLAGERLVALYGAQAASSEIQGFGRMARQPGGLRSPLFLGMGVQGFFTNSIECCDAFVTRQMLV